MYEAAETGQSNFSAHSHIHTCVDTYVTEFCGALPQAKDDQLWQEGQN